ncbi:MAG TPA: hypothetical protein VIQ24_03310 [Pyrinomonadaceae bacterium]
MSKKLHLMIIPLILVGSTLGGAISSKLLSATPVLARQADEPSSRQQWEYCALSKAAYVNASREGYWIIYFRDTGAQVVDVQSSATDGHGASMAKAITRLGAEGWEMVGQGQLDVRPGATNALYFKRQK